VPGNEVNTDKELVLTDRERKLIELLRITGYGQLVIYLEQGQPVRVEELKKSIKL